MTTSPLEYWINSNKSNLSKNTKGQHAQRQAMSKYLGHFRQLPLSSQNCNLGPFYTQPEHCEGCNKISDLVCQSDGSSNLLTQEMTADQNTAVRHKIPSER